MPNKKADIFRWDGVVRATHWGVAIICISNLWLNEAGDEWHEWLGYGVAGLIALRLLWGISWAKGYARLSALIPNVADFRQQAAEMRSRTLPAPGHHGTGKLAVWALWLVILATAFSGWFQNTEAGFELGADEWHEICAGLLQILVGLHLFAVLFTSWRQRSNLLKRMLPARLLR